MSEEDSNDFIEAGISGDEDLLEKDSDEIFDDGLDDDEYNDDE